MEIEASRIFCEFLNEVNRMKYTKSFDRKKMLKVYIQLVILIAIYREMLWDKEVQKNTAKYAVSLW